MEIKAISPETNKAVIEAIAKKIETPTISVPTSTVNNGFTTNGTHAILYISNSNNVIWYTLKNDSNATFNIITKENSTEYPLNFGGKLKITIIQK